MGNNLRKEFKGMDVKISEFLNAKKEAVAEIEKLIEYEERSIKENEEYIKRLAGNIIVYEIKNQKNNYK